MYIIGLDEKLRDIQKKINKIEDDDSDFSKNKKWKKLREEQDFWYKIKKQEMEEDEQSL